MTPDRWNAITAIFHAAIARDTDAREAFLAEACDGDPTLRAEVEAMLAAHRLRPPGSEAVSATAAPWMRSLSYRLERRSASTGSSRCWAGADRRGSTARSTCRLASRSRSNPAGWLAGRAGPPGAVRPRGACTRGAEPPSDRDDSRSRGGRRVITDRVEVNPRLMMGKAVIRGTRIPVELILRKMSEGASEADLLEAYPHLIRDDLRAALAMPPTPWRMKRSSSSSQAEPACRELGR